MDTPFQFFAPLSFFEKAEAPTGQKRRIAGVISTEMRDKQGEILLQRGLDFGPFLKSGWYNDNHSKKTTDVLGYPESVKRFQRGEKLPDGSMAKANGTWAEGYLLDTPEADRVWALGKALEKAGNTRRLGYSVEGGVVERTGADGKTVAKAVVRNVAITNCFPGTVRVIGAPEKVTRRDYSGPMVKIVLRSGKKLTGTPNHPVLTQRGWVTLGELDECKDSVGCFDGDVVPTPGVAHDEDDVPPTLAEVFNLAALTGVQTRAVRQGEFHGDVLTDGNVDVVLADGELKARMQSAFTQQFGKNALPASDKLQSSFPGLSATLSLLEAGLLTASGLVRSFGELGVLLGSPGSVLAPVLLRQGTDHTSPGGEVMHRPAVYPETVRDGACTLSSAVRFDNLVSKCVFDFSGHVFNLDTQLGWYGADGIVAHNCPVGEDTRLEVLAKSMVAIEKGLSATPAATPPGVNPSEAGDVTGNSGKLLMMQHLETGDDDDEDKLINKSMAVAAIQNRMNCDRETAERAYGLFLHMKQQTLPQGEHT